MEMSTRELWTVLHGMVFGASVLPAGFASSGIASFALLAIGFALTFPPAAALLSGK